MLNSPHGCVVHNALWQDITAFDHAKRIVLELIRWPCGHSIQQLLVVEICGATHSGVDNGACTRSRTDRAKELTHLIRY